MIERLPHNLAFRNERRNDHRWDTDAIAVECKLPRVFIRWGRIRGFDMIIGPSVLIIDNKE